MQPADVVNRSIDLLPGAEIIGSMTDGTKESEAARRIYGPTLRQLLRTAHWSFARKSAPLLLLGDSTGTTLAPNGQAIPTTVELPWTYAYAWPNDGIAPRYLPATLTVNGSTVPLMTGLNTASAYASPRPARFLVSSTDQFPIASGQIDWDNLPDLSGEGVGLTSRRIVLTNEQDAILVYTSLILEIEMWDALFAQAMVAIIASHLALPLIDDRKLALAIRGEQIALAKQAIGEARAASANESGFPKNRSYIPDFIRARTGGGGQDGWGDGLGVWQYGWGGMAFADGSVF